MLQAFKVSTMHGGLVAQFVAHLPCMSIELKELFGVHRNSIFERYDAGIVWVQHGYYSGLL